MRAHVSSCTACGPFAWHTSCALTRQHLEHMKETATKSAGVGKRAEGTVPICTSVTRAAFKPRIELAIWHTLSFFFFLVDGQLFFAGRLLILFSRMMPAYVSSRVYRHKSTRSHSDRVFCEITLDAELRRIGSEKERTGYPGPSSPPRHTADAPATIIAAKRRIIHAPN